MLLSPLPSYVGTARQGLKLATSVACFTYQIELKVSIISRLSGLIKASRTANAALSFLALGRHAFSGSKTSRQYLLFAIAVGIADDGTVVYEASIRYRWGKSAKN